MIAVLDAAYGGDIAAGACVLASDLSAAEPVAIHTIVLPAVADYEPGAFYRRELPVLLALFDHVVAPLKAVVIDGYAVLDREDRPGLGAHLASALRGRVPVIGVAKTAFSGDNFSIRVLRGQSSRPLHVTAVGLDPAHAGRMVETMHGGYRIPTLCRLADRWARDALSEALHRQGTERDATAT